MTTQFIELTRPDGVTVLFSTRSILRVEKGANGNPVRVVTEDGSFQVQESYGFICETLQPEGV